MLRFENISVKFNSRYILKDFSLDIKKTDKILLFGRSGIGKSTVLKLALGYLRPESGRIYYKDHLFSRDIVWQLRREVAYVSQDMEIGTGNVLAYFRLVFSYKVNAHIKDFLKDLNELMDFFGLNPDSLHKNIEELSGGEKQRLMIITSILLNRKLFFLDEITSGLDLELKKKVISFFLNRNEWTEIIISHDNEWRIQPGIKVVNMEKIIVNS
jgi:putative ABC transport system ATP-binding protein